jgi:hypothetical protein
VLYLTRAARCLHRTEGKRRFLVYQAASHRVNRSIVECEASTTALCVYALHLSGREAIFFWCISGTAVSSPEHATGVDTGTCQQLPRDAEKASTQVMRAGNASVTFREHQSCNAA